MTIEEFETHLPWVEEFLKDNTHLFKKPTKVRHHDWPKYLKTMEESGMEIHPFHGKCCQISHFLLFFSGGKGSNKLELQIRRPAMKYCELPDGTELVCTHWWVRDVQTKKIYDLSKDQFIYGYPVEQFYNTSIKADIGYPYFSLPGGYRSPKYGENVPTREVLELGRAYRDEFGSAGGLDWWIDEFDKQVKLSKKVVHSNLSVV